METMFKKIALAVILVALILGGAYWLKNKYHCGQTAPEATPPSNIAVSAEQPVTYELNSLPETCQLNSKMACAVELAVKCKIKLDVNGWKNTKMSNFIFMKKSSLQKTRKKNVKKKENKTKTAGLSENYTQKDYKGKMSGFGKGNIN